MYPPVRNESPAQAWRRAGESLVRELSFRDFDEAIAFVERIGAAAEDYQRRPDMCILDFNRVRLTITNPHHSHITDAELRLAEKVDAVVDAAWSARSSQGRT